MPPVQILFDRGIPYGSLMWIAAAMVVSIPESDEGRHASGQAGLKKDG